MNLPDVRWLCLLFCPFLLLIYGLITLSVIGSTVLAGKTNVELRIRKDLKKKSGLGLLNAISQQIKKNLDQYI